MSDVPDGLLEVGRVGRPHGIRGDIFIDLTTDRAERAAVGSRLFIAGSWREIVTSATSNDRWRVHFDGLDVREEAGLLTGQHIYAEPIDDPAAAPGPRPAAGTLPPHLTNCGVPRGAPGPLAGLSPGPSPASAARTDVSGSRVHNSRVFIIIIASRTDGAFTSRRAAGPAATPPPSPAPPRPRIARPRCQRRAGKR